MKNIAILVFDDVEVLDFCGPFEVFSVTGQRDNLKPFNVYMVAVNHTPVIARNNFSINPPYNLSNCPEPDILLIPGGYGTRRELNNEALLGWVKGHAGTAELLLSVCTGALILGKAGLLDGLQATTHHGVIELLKEVAPKTEVRESERIVDNGRIILSAGISAGIDMALYVVSKLLGEEQARETATYMEYYWSPKTKVHSTNG